MNKSTKALTTTFGLTILLFGFIIFLLYVIYCYAYYDKYQEQVYIENINNKKYSFIYENLTNKGSLTYEQFISHLHKSTDKDNLLEIFNTYYKDSGLYNEETFLNRYLFNNIKVDSEDVVFSYDGNTNLFERKNIYIDEIKISNGTLNTTWGVINKVNFKVEDNSILRVDNKELECLNSVCTSDLMYGGLHEVSYVSNGYEYYALVNVYKDKQEINVTNLDSLVKISELEVNLRYGKYSINKCNLDTTKCPSLSKSYLMINEDNTFVTYTYYVSTGKSIIDSGTYVLEDNRLVMKSRLGKDTYIVSGNNLIGEDTDFNYIYVD